MKKLILLSILLIVGCATDVSEPIDCAGIAGGTSVVDECGVCDCDSSNDNTTCVQDCDGVEDFEEYCYATIEIGEQTWMAENLRTSIIEVNDSSFCNSEFGSLPPCYWDLDTTYNSIIKMYNSNFENNLYGRLYHSNLVGTSSGIELHICPDGWHIPSIDDFITLSIYLDSPIENQTGTGYYNGYSILSDKLRDNKDGYWIDDTTANNLSGFSALPSGYFHNATQHYNVGKASYFWLLISEDSPSGKTVVMIFSETVGTTYGVSISPLFSSNFNSIRCIKD